MPSVSAQVLEPAKLLSVPDGVASWRGQVLLSVKTMLPDGRTAAPRTVPKLFAELESTTQRIWPAVVISPRPLGPSAKNMSPAVSKEMPFIGPLSAVAIAPVG